MLISLKQTILEPEMPFITRTAPGVGSNVGEIKVVVPSKSTQMKWFSHSGGNQ